MSAIECAGLGMRYGSRWALRDCNLCVPLGGSWRWWGRTAAARQRFSTSLPGSSARQPAPSRSEARCQVGTPDLSAGSVWSHRMFRCTRDSLSTAHSASDDDSTALGRFGRANPTRSVRHPPGSVLASFPEVSERRWRSRSRSENARTRFSSTSRSPTSTRWRVGPSCRRCWTARPRPGTLVFVASRRRPGACLRLPHPAGVVAGSGCRRYRRAPGQPSRADGRASRREHYRRRRGRSSRSITPIGRRCCWSVPRDRSLIHGGHPRPSASRTSSWHIWVIRRHGHFRRRASRWHRARRRDLADLAPAPFACWWVLSRCSWSSRCWCHRHRDAFVFHISGFAACLARRPVAPLWRAPGRTSTPVISSSSRSFWSSRPSSVSSGEGHSWLGSWNRGPIG